MDHALLLNMEYMQSESFWEYQSSHQFLFIEQLIYTLAS